MINDPSPFGVSVVIPLFNKGPFIERTVQSVFSQTLEPIEIVIVDDGSTDDSFGRIAHYESEFVKLRQQKNRGPGDARNKGASLAHGEWLAFLDGDDLWCPDHLETLANLSALFPDADVLVTNHHRALHGEPIDLEAQAAGDGNSRRLNFMRDPLCHPRVNSSVIAVRRAAFLQKNGFPSFCPGEDTDLWFRLALDHQYAITDRVTAIIVRNTGGVMDKHESQSKLGFELPQLFRNIDGMIAEMPPTKAREVSFYRDTLVRRSLKQAIHRAESDVARSLVSRIQHRRPSDIVWAVASVLPSNILRWTVRSTLWALKAVTRSL